MEKNKNLSPSLEDYLETILVLERKNRVARVKDIAESLSVQMPSVTGALKNLKAKGLIEYEKNSFINLTANGVDIAVKILEKHDILSAFLEKILFLSEEKASEEACKIEHSIDTDTALRIKNLTRVITSEIYSSDTEKSRWTKEILSL